MNEGQGNSGNLFSKLGGNPGKFQISPHEQSVSGLECKDMHLSGAAIVQNIRRQSICIRTICYKILCILQ